jgi:inorganic pyrophosphatase
MPKTPWDRLTPRPSQGLVNVVVETPRGSRNKYKYDEKLGLFRLNRVLSAGLSFPYDFGYVPGTRGGDDDPLDVLVLMDEPAFPGCLVRARAIGVLKATKEGLPNDRVLAVSTEAKAFSDHRDLSDLPRKQLREIEHFFLSILSVDGQRHALLGFRGVAEAERVIERAIVAEERRKAGLKKKKQTQKPFRKR